MNRVSKAKQLPSWSQPSGNPQFPGLVAQIFFATDQAELDDGDKRALAAVIKVYRVALLGRRVCLSFEGNADHRGTAEHNQNLGQRRAESVRRFCDEALLSLPLYSSQSGSFGERFASRRGLAGDRRVDVFSSYLATRPPVVLPGFTVKGSYSGPLSKTFDFRTILGSSVGLGVVSAQVLSLEIRNSRTGSKATFTYTGVGAGLGMGMSRPSGWTTKDVGSWMDVDDFEGAGRVVSAAVGYGANSFIFHGPIERGRTTKPVIVSFTGLDVAVGFGGDLMGHWHKR